MKLRLIILILLLAACRDQQAPPAPTSKQTDQLDDAEAMLNELAANAEGPADRSAGPSNQSN